MTASYDRRPPPQGPRAAAARREPPRAPEGDREEIELARFPKGPPGNVDGIAVFVILAWFNGHPFVNVREFFRSSSGEYFPTPKGTTIKVRHLDATIAALQKARAILDGTEQPIAPPAAPSECPRCGCVDSTIRNKADRLGRPMIAWQCDGCMDRIGDWIPRSSAPSDAPAWVEAAR